ncbi:ankyrin repeat domain-containing protein [Pendulispora rubella]|uniref:Ankyrin repeat domain-containing protein n=1 Tax=Pendulispora rubella TaxID=2741070 RepID=A0ABZ2KU59_9BACT
MVIRISQFHLVWPSVLLSLAVLSCSACGKGAEGKKETASVENSVDATQVFTDPQAAQVAEAAAKGDTARIEQLIKAGANPNAVGDKGTSLLEWAMLTKNKASFETLLNAGADPTHTDEQGDTVMHYAAKANDAAYLDVLIAHRVDVNVPNPVSGATPLMGALMAEREVQFHKLLQAGANPNVTDRAGNSPLHVAAKINENQRVLDLLKAGADPLAKNRQNLTFQRYLTMTPSNILSADAKRQREEVVTWLREHHVAVEDAPTKKN